MKETLTDSKEAARMKLFARNSQHNLAELSMEMADMTGSSMEIAGIKPSQQGPALLALPALPGTMNRGRPRDRGRPRENRDLAQKAGGFDMQSIEVVCVHPKISQVTDME